MLFLRKYFKRKNQRELLLIFIGDLGTNVLNQIYLKKNDDLHVLAINTDVAHLSNNVNIDDSLKLFIGDKTEHSCGKRDFESGVEYVMQKKRLLKRTIRKYPAKEIILIGGLRFSSASGVIAGLSKILKCSRYKTTAIVSTPFTTEGQNAFINSSKALTILNKNVDELISFSCEDLLRENGGKLLITDLDKRFGDILNEVLNSLRILFV